MKSELNRDKGKEYDPDKESAMTCDLKAWFKVNCTPYPLPTNSVVKLERLHFLHNYAMTFTFDL